MDQLRKERERGEIFRLFWSTLPTTGDRDLSQKVKYNLQHAQTSVFRGEPLWATLRVISDGSTGERNAPFELIRAKSVGKTYFNTGTQKKHVRTYPLKHETC